MWALGITLLATFLVLVGGAPTVGQYSLRQAYRLRGGDAVIGRPYSLSDQAAAASFSVKFPEVQLFPSVSLS